MEKIINYNLLFHPVNWLIIFLVLYLGALLVKTVHDSVNGGASPFASLFNQGT